MRSEWTLIVRALPPILMVESNLKECLEELDILCQETEIRSNPYDSYALGFAFLQFYDESTMEHAKDILQRVKLLDEHKVQVNRALTYQMDQKYEQNPIVQRHITANRNRHRHPDDSDTSSESD